MWWLLLALWLILLVQIRARSLYGAVAAYFLQAAAIFGLCAYEAFQRVLSEGGRFSWLGLGFLMVAAVPGLLTLGARKEIGGASAPVPGEAACMVSSVPSGPYPFGNSPLSVFDKEDFGRQDAGNFRAGCSAVNRVSAAAALGMGLAYILLDSLLPFAAGRDYMATGAAFFLAGMGMVLLSSGKTARLIGLCSVGNGLFLTCFLLFQEAQEIMQGMILVQVILAVVVLSLSFRWGRA